MGHSLGRLPWAQHFVSEGFAAQVRTLSHLDSHGTVTPTWESKSSNVEESLGDQSGRGHLQESRAMGENAQVREREPRTVWSLESELILNPSSVLLSCCCNLSEPLSLHFKMVIVTTMLI